MDKLEGLECSERAKNIINQKISFFYIEAIPQKFSQLRKKNVFFRVHWFSSCANRISSILQIVKKRKCEFCFQNSKCSNFFVFQSCELIFSGIGNWVLIRSFPGSFCVWGSSLKGVPTPGVACNRQYQGILRKYLFLQNP